MRAKPAAQKCSCRAENKAWMWSLWFGGWRHQSGQVGVGAGEVCVRVCHLLQVVSYLEIETACLPFMTLKFIIFFKICQSDRAKYHFLDFLPQNQTYSSLGSAVRCMVTMALSRVPSSPCGDDCWCPSLLRLRR